MHFHLIGLNCRYSHSCLALFYARSELHLHLQNPQTTISQFTINDPYYETLLRISGSSADVLFFSVYIWNASYISRLVTDLALIQPGRPIVLGGPQATALKRLPENCTVVDGAIEGAGEGFYHNLEAGNLKSSYMAKSGRPFQFPYLDEDFSGELLNRQVYYESSRGCPFNCSYCLSSVDKGVVHKEVKQVEEELECILRHQPKIIKFVDRTFNDNPERALAIWHYLAAQPGKTQFHFEIAPDRFTEEMFAFLKTVGPDRFRFEIGIQSTNPETLAAVNRKMDVETAAGNISRLTAFDNIHLHVDLILGLPCETGESFRKSFNRVFALRAHYIQMGLLKVLPGTAISNDAEDLGIVSCEQPPYQVLANRWMDHKTMSTLYAFGECVEAFYNSRCFRSIWTYLLKRKEEPFHFFKQLLEVSGRPHYFGLAATQEMLTRIFCEMVDDRPDRDILRELLRYDWLRCGHRFLPDFLEAEPLAEVRSKLWKKLPQNLEGLYTCQSRSEFFKRAVFLEISRDALLEVGLHPHDQRTLICLLPEQTQGVIKHSRAVTVECE